MTRVTTTTKKKITDLSIHQVKQKVLNWAKKFDTFCFLDNHQYDIPPHSIECLLGAGARRLIQANAGRALQALSIFLEERTDGHPPWLFGHMGYDLKNEMEDLHSSHPDRLGFPDLFFFEPEVLVRMTDEEISIEGAEAEKVLEEIMYTQTTNLAVLSQPGIIKSRFSKQQYIATIQQLREHIHRGDCYEINFCQEFYMENVQADAVAAYLNLSKISPNPFSALYRIGERWLIGASPERFLKKQGNRIISQPIKGTSKRKPKDAALDMASKEALAQSLKDKAENVMVVDLVRNDLARICKEGSVTVDELYGIYTFPQVYQMISTVSGELRPGVKFPDIIRACFPMGSMTGAPKKKVMELIEQYEKTRRGLFSGALGYISPAGFDFNVVIRSILYNAQTQYLSFPAGSGITFYSDAEQEWEECQLKADAIRSILGA